MTLLALTREVPPGIADCELTHIERRPIDVARAREQHARYEDALRALGCRVERIAAAPALPDSVFVEDAAFVVDECAVITRPGAPSRRPETAAVADVLRVLRPIFYVDAPGTLDGGDVLRLGRRIWVGLSSRTNEDGARQLADALSRFGYTVQTVATHGCLHLKSAATALGDDHLLINPDWVSAAALGGVPCVRVDASEPHAANVLSIRHDVLCPADAPRTAERLTALGYRVHPIDASELAKAEAGLTCCSLLLSVAPDALPA